jgi:hypothetical protein
MIKYSTNERVERFEEYLKFMETKTTEVPILDFKFYTADHKDSYFRLYPKLFSILAKSSLAGPVIAVSSEVPEELRPTWATYEFLDDKSPENRGTTNLLHREIESITPTDRKRYLDLRITYFSALANYAEINNAHFSKAEVEQAGLNSCYLTEVRESLKYLEGLVD